MFGKGSRANVLLRIAAQQANLVIEMAAEKLLAKIAS